MAGKKKGKTSKPKTEKRECELVMCEDPKTGEIIIRPRNCPRGYVEKMRDKCSEQGATFLIPKVDSREED